LGKFTIAAGLFLLGVAGVDAQGFDQRQAVERTSEEQTFVLGQMRLFLSTIAELQDDLARGDLAQAALHAAERGVKQSANLARPASLAAKETDEWKQLIRATRLGFDDIAVKAAAGGSRDESLGLLAWTMRNCVACHESYHIVVVDK
jgi:hypothetical protein